MAAQRKPYCRNCDSDYIWHEWATRARANQGRCKYPKKADEPTTYEECRLCGTTPASHTPSCKTGRPHCTCDACF